MSNVYALPVPAKSQPPSEMTERERDHLMRFLRKTAPEQLYPVSRLMVRLATMVGDYALEEVAVKDLAPKGFLMSATYPTYGLHWVFRLHGHRGPPVGDPATQWDLLLTLQNGFKTLRVAEYAARFPYRFLNDLEEILRIEAVYTDPHCLVVSGCLQATPFALDGSFQHLPFEMILTRR